MAVELEAAVVAVAVVVVVAVVAVTVAIVVTDLHAAVLEALAVHGRVGGPAMVDVHESLKQVLSFHS